MDTLGDQSPRVSVRWNKRGGDVKKWSNLSDAEKDEIIEDFATTVVALKWLIVTLYTLLIVFGIVFLRLRF